MGHGFMSVTTGTAAVDKLDSGTVLSSAWMPSTKLWSLSSAWMPSTKLPSFLGRKTSSLTVVGPAHARYEVDFSPSDLLIDLKKKIEAASGIEPDRQKLTLRETALSNNTAPLMTLGIAPGVNLTLSKSFPAATIKDPLKMKALLYASDLEGVREAALQGYDLDVEGDSHYDLLHEAAMDGDLEMVQLIVETGVSVFSLTRHYPKTALQVAAKYNQKRVCEFLIASGLDPREKNKMRSDDSGRRIESWDAIEYASRQGHRELAEWLGMQPSPGRRHSEL